MPSRRCRKPDGDPPRPSSIGPGLSASFRGRGVSDYERGRPSVAGDDPVPGAEDAVKAACDSAADYLESHGYAVETIVLSTYLVVDGQTLSAVEGAPAETPRKLISLLMWGAQKIGDESGLL